MATTFSSMSFNTQFHGTNNNLASNQCIDPSEIENFVDFGASMPSPSTSNVNGKAPMHHMSRSTSMMTSPSNAIAPLDFEEQQVPIKPSHEYERFKQQTGLPTGSYGSLTGLTSDFDGFSSSMAGDLGVGSSNMFAGMGSNSGLGIDTDMNFDDVTPTNDLPAFFYPGQPNQDFVDPSSISQPEQTQHIRFYPGMHSQAAMAKAQQEAQQKQQAPKRRTSEQQGRSGRKSVSPVDARTEETIARVVNQIRQNNNASSYSQDADSPPSMSLHMSKSRKDEEDMDEDERLLASEEGKKLSSKERRQLRNKVSARAFRSRRKEYISQMEGEVQAKVNEMNDLRVQNRALMEENARFRELTVKLLRHPAFTPFLEDISRDPALSESLNKVHNSMSATAALGDATSATEDIKPLPASMASQQVESLHIGMATIPETQLDFSALNLNGSNTNSLNAWAMPSMNGFSFQQPQVFAVTEVPEAPADLEQELGAIKGEECIIERFTPTAEISKEEIRTIEKPVEVESKTEDEKTAAINDSIELGADFELYNDTPSSTSSSRKEAEFEPLLTDFAAEKIFGYELVAAESGDALDRRLAGLSARCERFAVVLERMSMQFE